MRGTGHWITAPGPVNGGLSIGLLGGSFDPAHEGHLYISDVARKALKLDYVWWLVSPGNPLKPEPDALAVRLSRARLVASRHPFIRVTDIEQRLRTRYTVDTVKALTRRFPGARFVWLMGSDNLEQFHRWRCWAEIVALVPVAVIERPGSILAPLRAKAMQRFAGCRGQTLRRAPSLVVLDGRRNEVSATAIRALGTPKPGMLD